MISPQNTRTLKTYAASLMSTWLISDIDWIIDSAAKGSWLPEEKYGFRNIVNPLKGKKFYLTPSFVSHPKSKEFRMSYLKCLIEQCSDGEYVNEPQHADFVIGVEDEEPGLDKITMRVDGNQSPIHLDWTALITMIPSPP